MELTVDQILSEELYEYNKIKKASKETVSTLILRASKKLKDSEICQPNEISRILKKKFVDHKSLVEKVLPDEYKLVTKPKEDDIPKTIIQEYFYLSKQLYYEKANLCSKIYQILKHDSEFENIVKDQKFGSIDELHSELAEIEILKNQIDKREKLHDWQKIIVRKMSLEDTLHHVAEKFDQSAKWIKHINEDEKLNKIVEEIKKCPACGWDIAKWFNINSERVRKGLPVIQPRGNDQK